MPVLIGMESCLWQLVVSILSRGLDSGKMFGITLSMKIKYTILSVLLLVVLLFGSVGCGVNASPGDGTKIGQIVKLTKTGLFSKTYEAEIIRGGMTGGSGAFGVTPFDFTIESEEQAKTVQDYMDHQTEVIITYRSEGLYSLCRTDSAGHFLKTITPATNSASADAGGLFRK